MSHIKLLIGADLVPTKSNETLFADANLEELLGKTLMETLASAECRVFNLEVPLTNLMMPIDKCGPCVVANTETIHGIEAMGVDVFTLANNHIMDQGEQGLSSTIRILHENGIAFVGAGANSLDAAKPLIMCKGEKSFGILACAEHEFSIAEADKPGANPFDPLETPDQVAALKAQCDFVVVLYHGGKEHYRYPSPILQKTCRKLVEKGADLIIAQHSHCIGCMEAYQNGTIIYGQGNFLFDDGDNEFWNTSILVEVSDSMHVNYIPLVKRGSRVRQAEGAEAERILQSFYERSEEIQRPGFLECEYRNFADKFLQHYLLFFSGINRRSMLFRVLNRLTYQKWQAWLLERKYKKETRLAIQNYVECEAHRELLLKGISHK